MIQFEKIYRLITEGDNSQSDIVKYVMYREAIELMTDKSGIDYGQAYKLLRIPKYICELWVKYTTQGYVCQPGELPVDISEFLTKMLYDYVDSHY